MSDRVQLPFRMSVELRAYIEVARGDVPANLWLTRLVEAHQRQNGRRPAAPGVDAAPRAVPSPHPAASRDSTTESSDAADQPVNEPDQVVAAEKPVARRRAPKPANEWGPHR